MAVKYHINPDKGPLICEAKTPDACLYGSDAPHFGTKEEASEQWQKDLKNTFGSIPVKRRKTRKNILTNYEEMTTESLIDFADESFANYQVVESIIDERLKYTEDRFSSLARINPYLNESSACPKGVYKSLIRDFNSYRDKTAELVEVSLESKFYVPSYTVLDNPPYVGKAVLTESRVQQTAEWVKERYNTLGGSDVGVLASIDFTENPSGLMRASIKGLEKSKIIPPTEEDLNKHFGKPQRKGAMYRGSVWESRIRNDYAKDHLEMKVYDVEGQYLHPERSWQKVNFDGVISDREDGHPTGILEIKTGSDAQAWSDGPPLNYRAQTLYYLNTTDLEYADIRAVINDNEVIEYRLHKDEEVAAGAGINMETYIQQRVIPWFDDVKSRRKDLLTV